MIDFTEKVRINKEADKTLEAKIGRASCRERV